MNRYCLLLLLCGLAAPAFAQNPDSLRILRVMSYNTENFLDYRRDSLPEASSTFMPDSLKHWNAKRYYLKRDNIARVIAAVGEWNPPALVALCEIGNRRVLDDLVKHSALRNLKYSVAHFESPDPRGIDVALLYRPQLFSPYMEKPVHVRFPDNPRRRTRDILYVAGLLPGRDTLHVFVCHFPSRLGGELESESGRMTAAKILRLRVDSILALNRRANILLMGDFNDYPENRSICQGLRVLPGGGQRADTVLYNLCYALHKEGRVGSYKHDGQWDMLDQIIVSGHLLNTAGRLFVQGAGATVLDAPFLLEDDPGFGKRPFRTYIGMKYHGGYSDHLPVFIDLVVK